MTSLPWLAAGDPFPPTATALVHPNGLLAAGADLSVDTLLRAYRAGIFPWFSEDDPILWWSPSPRALLWPHHLHISHSLAKSLRNDGWEVSIDRDFRGVIRACATTPRDGQNGTWITATMQEAYVRLHEAGHAHSVEVWQQGELVGGLYGVRIGAMFFGESMFSHRPDASKVALVHLCRQPGIRLIDCQMETPHLWRMGARLATRPRFERALAAAMRIREKDRPPPAWEPSCSPTRAES